MAIEEELRTSNNGVLIKKIKVYREYEKINAKALKQEAKDLLEIEVNGVSYDGDTVSINYMSSVVAIANFKFNQAIALGMTPTEAYDEVYKQTIGWKGADNEVHQVQGESVAEALEEAMGAVANIVGA